jgi:pimeloyl-ACP methyl ester carboxylesterase
MKNLFFVHGGPGLNSFAERCLLEPELLRRGIRTTFWDEPSILRPTQNQAMIEPSYQAWIKALEEEFIDFIDGIEDPANEGLILMAHSFGVFGALRLLERYEDTIQWLCLVSPSLWMVEAQKNIFECAAKDYESISNESSELLRKLARKTKGVFDPPSREAFDLALRDPQLFSHYFESDQRQLEWMECLSNPAFSFDERSFNGVLESFADESQQLKKREVPIIVVFGEQDPIVSRKLEIETAREMTTKLYPLIIDSARHFPHLERIEVFLDKLEGIAIKNESQEIR